MTPVWDDPRVAVGLPRMLTSRRAMMAKGAGAIGWKVGFGAPASLELMQIGAPVMGFLTDATLVASDASVATAGWSRPVVEFEVAVYLGRDLAPGASLVEARRAIAAVGPSIEVADIDLAIEPSAVTEVIAGNIFHRAVVLGDRDPGRAGLDISGLTARISIDGVERTTVTDLEALTGPYPEVVATVANTLGSAGELLREGDVIITGSVIPPVSGADGTEFTFALDPFDPITIRCS